MSFAPAQPDRLSPLRRIAALAWRYGISAIGPVSVSASHFIASILFLHALPPADFGAFSFLLIVVPFCMSITGSLIGAPVSNAINRHGELDPGTLQAFRKTALLLTLCAFVAVTILLRFSEGHWHVAALLGLYGAAMALRWCGRGFAFAADRVNRAVLSDLVYSGLLIATLTLLSVTGNLDAVSAAIVLFVSAAAALLAFGRTYLREQFGAWHNGKLALYADTWRDLSRWALMGVVLTEATANAHAYFVTFISGTASFALLAVGGLMMRPLSLVLSALTDRERPAIARYLAAGDTHGAKRTVWEFSIVGVAMWAATVCLAASIFIWFPELLLAKGYDTNHLLPVVIIWSAIWASRTLWTPQTVLLQAAGEYSKLAQASMWSCVVALSVTLILLLTVGPVASLLGVLAGDVVIGSRIFALANSWRRRHG